MNKAFYQIFYQNDTLYAFPKKVEQKTVSDVKVVVEQPKAEIATPQALPAKPIPVATTPQLNHKVLILVNETPDLSANDGVFLEKILNAVGLSSETVDIFNIANHKNVDFKSILENKKVNHIVSFGVPFLKVNIDVMINRYDPKTAAGVTLLLAEPLSIIQADDTHKRALWGKLKQIFK